MLALLAATEGWAAALDFVRGAREEAYALGSRLVAGLSADDRAVLTEKMSEVVGAYERIVEAEE